MRAPTTVADPVSTSSVLVRGLALAVASLLTGGATSFAQEYLPEAFASFANSPSGWTILTVGLVLATRSGPAMGAVYGALCFVCLVLGYTVASELRGYSYQPLFWSGVGVVTGPVIGAAAAALTSRRTEVAAVGSGIIAGALLTDGLYGLTVLADTTSPVYWTCVISMALALLIVVAKTRLRRLATIGWQVLTAAAVTVAGVGGYALLNQAIGG